MNGLERQKKSEFLLHNLKLEPNLKILYILHIHVYAYKHWLGQNDTRRKKIIIVLYVFFFYYFCKVIRTNEKKMRAE